MTMTTDKEGKKSRMTPTLKLTKSILAENDPQVECSSFRQPPALKETCFKATG
jgi:hypothetical protein